MNLAQDLARSLSDLRTSRLAVQAFDELPSFNARALLIWIDLSTTHWAVSVANSLAIAQRLVMSGAPPSTAAAAE